MTDQLWIDGEGPYEVENFKNGERIDDAELDLDIIVAPEERRPLA